MTHRTWYAAQRAGLHLDNVKSGAKRKSAYVAERLRTVVATLGLDEQAAATMSGDSRLLLYAEGETVQHPNTIPGEVGFITDGDVQMFIRAEGGRQIPLGTLSAGDYLGATALTRQRVTTAWSRSPT